MPKPGSKMSWSGSSETCSEYPSRLYQVPASRNRRRLPWRTPPAPRSRPPAPGGEPPEAERSGLRAPAVRPRQQPGPIDSDGDGGAGHGSRLVAAEPSNTPSHRLRRDRLAHRLGSALPAVGGGVDQGRQQDIGPDQLRFQLGREHLGEAKHRRLGDRIGGRTDSPIERLAGGHVDDPATPGGRHPAGSLAAGPPAAIEIEPHQEPVVVFTHLQEAGGSIPPGQIDQPARPLPQLVDPPP